MIPIQSKKDALDAHWDMISPQVLKRINNILRVKKIPKGKGALKKYYKLSDRLESFLTTIKTPDKLKTYLQLDSDGLKVKIKWFEDNLPSAIHRPIGKEISKEPDYYILQSIFIGHGYSHKTFKKLDFIQSLNIDTCVYCNRNYIYALDELGKIKPEIDHFYPKGIYPFLGVCFYNLIPSCQTCNGLSVKGSKDTFKLDILSPYEIQHEDFHFTYEPADLNYTNPITPTGAIDIKLDEEHLPNSKMFKISELYKKHEDHVLELIIKSQLEYSKKYRESLQAFDKHLFSEAEINRMIVGNYTELNELHKRPLSKLYRDIAIELGLIKEENK